MWGRLIEKKFDLLASQAAQEQQVATKDTGALLRRFYKSRKRQDVLEQQERFLHLLSPRQGQIDAIWRRERKRGTTNWILETPQYKSWKTATQPVLRVTGHLGCGKTVALANIISDLAMANIKCGGFICKRDDPSMLKGVTILGSIAYQLVQSITVYRDWEALFQSSASDLGGSMTISSIIQLLQNLLPQSKTFHIVLDGLQECAKEEVEVVLEAISDLRKSHRVSVCFSTTLDGLSVELTENYLGTANVLCLNDSHRDSEIKEYIRKEVKRRNAVRQPPLNGELENLVIEQLTMGAQGMYLWVSLHLETIFPPYNDGILTDESVLNILHHLPQDLPEAFDQALGRISDRRYGDRIFQLVAVAETPLSGEQLNVALTVQPGNIMWDGTKLPRSSKQVVARCGGGLLQVDEEDGCVRFIHHSVVSHMGSLRVGIDGRRLARSWIVDAETFMGSVCVTYLNFPDFDRPHLTHEDGPNVDVLWRTLVNNRPPHVLIPWAQSLDPMGDKGGMLDYAIRHSHAYLYRFMMSPPFILAAYCLALLLNDVMEDEDTRLLDITSHKIQENTYALGMARDFEETKAENVTDRLWELIEMGCSSRYNPLSGIFWDYRFSVVNWEGDAQYLELLAFRYAFLHNNFNLVVKIASNCAVESSVVAQAVEETKLQAKSLIHSKLLPGRLKEPTSYVMEQELAEDPTLAAARTYMVNKEYDKALDTIQCYTRLSGIGSINHKLISQIHVLQQRMVLRWVIDHRCEKVFQRLAFLRQAVLDWPTVLIYAITTYAHAGPPNDEDLQSEREIFYGLLEELKQVDPEGNRTMGSEGTLDIDPGWTALHAAALWQSFAVEALINTWPDIANSSTRLGHTPLVVALCGPLEDLGASLAVSALLRAGADTGALSAFPYLSPLDISIAYRPHRISRLLIESGATRAELVKGTQDLAVHTLVERIALLESRMAFEGNSTEWVEQTQGVTSLEEYYRIGSSAWMCHIASWLGMPLSPCQPGGLRATI
ncbi:hypothetical protein NEUTE1DRAFT_126644 [Neurospora tetrasperma FGSC 2508]|uniref:Nephrocystin 3-like N-terminal domain-containing protein n=1 Tax=Neurospora tetrasperma (strain FGSC 2508 / ATCC MYA-4615 / P0657) TaxID=510951 RepID=F8N2D7_NEUT8|nr:uncharacterized protein NEUTE1DRAFT_126644 [Neurospora tetrasperma FGSC 2508]EGO53308.1 hypothetical protein NEUTE1DRAFT_126644 [Neurospora tetrasperma FGSC 2508]